MLFAKYDRVSAGFIVLACSENFAQSLRFWMQSLALDTRVIQQFRFLAADYTSCIS